ncbi:MAG: fimbrillin family protein [Rikenellaceae bacterium]
MKSHKINIALALLLLLVVGCSKDISTTMQLQLSDNEIAFVPDADSQFASKGSMVEVFDDIDSIGIFAYYNNAIYINNSKPVLQQDGYWSFSPAVNWPSSGSVNFIAYAPYVNTEAHSLAGFTLDSSVVNTLKIDYLMPEDCSAHEDLLVASASGKDGEIVSLVFNHTMAAVCFKVHESQDASLINKGFTLSGIYDKATLTITSSGFSWATRSVNSQSVYTEFVEGPSGMDQSLISKDNYIMAMPQNIPQSVSLSTTLSDGTPLSSVIAGTWSAGKIYTYVLYISDEEISVLDVEIDKWDDEGDADAGDYSPTPGTDVDLDIDSWGDGGNEDMINKTV